MATEMTSGEGVHVIGLGDTIVTCIWWLYQIPVLLNEV
jgi:hypothetical protein